MIKNRRWIKRDLPLQNFFLIAISFAIIGYIFSEEEETRVTKKLEQAKSHERDQRSIQGFSERACRSLWGNHHTFRDTPKAPKIELPPQEPDLK
jgi:hypothetical protein